ncbi:hypothetical protein CASFOL_033958 [Castilleja foliolosa]|uniref:Uncharacterized protein n=1 Tax=Castilleja foliolosa TaxID=1961234 RepID=A0ABD3C121_9LAMI
MAVLSSSISAKITPLCTSTPHSLTRIHRKFSPSLASLNPSSSPASPESSSASNSEKFSVSANGSSPTSPFVEPSKTSEAPYNYALANPNGNTFVRFVQSTESTIERGSDRSEDFMSLNAAILEIERVPGKEIWEINKTVIFDFRFLALLAVGGSLAGSLLCFLNGCVYIFDAYKVYWTSCVKGVHTGKMVLRLVEAIDVYLAGTVMLIFGMGLYGLFISNVPPNVPPSADRALKGSSLFGMFALKRKANVDEDQFARRAKDESGTCNCDDPSSEDV